MESKTKFAASARVLIRTLEAVSGDTPSPAEIEKIVEAGAEALFDLVVMLKVAWSA